MVERLFRLRRDGLYDEVSALFAERFEAISLADGRRYSSREDIGDFFARERTGGERTEVSANRLDACGDRVLAEGRMRHFCSGGFADLPAVWVFGVTQGLITEISPFRSRYDAILSFPEFGVPQLV